MEDPADRVVNGSEPVELLEHAVGLSAAEDYVGTALVAAIVELVIDDPDPTRSVSNVPAATWVVKIK
jgi:hypothetical protein